MEFTLNMALLNNQAFVKKSPYFLTVIREGLFSVSVDQIPLVEYFVVINGIKKEDKITIKLYKNVQDGKWYDQSYSEEAELNSPEFGIPAINPQVKRAIDEYEANRILAGTKNFA